MRRQSGNDNKAAGIDGDEYCYEPTCSIFVAVLTFCQARHKVCSLAVCAEQLFRTGHTATLALVEAGVFPCSGHLFTASRLEPVSYEYKDCSELVTPPSCTEAIWE